ncbi:hypothetical protein HYN69_01465 [Gemmobacter aquarius]|uniref:DUF937 domain-containing protein n=1 Tax=Paragemmobacter aquarius TaxID=2169400 RepID=A0A2S0UHR5_9RHOB|nr:YidB family protein [Gemmobacter aquarius]AWB47349.1 hypothetical protein HYN69_01465 [Gemmobacter aquarius]
MARSTPSLLALLGIATVAGYQNRDKLGDMLGGAGGASGQQPNASGGMFSGGLGGGQGTGSGGGLRGLLGSLGGGGLAGGIGELMERFGQSGHRDRAESWVGSGSNQPIDHSELEQALGHDTLDELAQTTGLSRSEILERLSHNLPQTVDRFTPHGRIPTEDEAQSLL